MQLNPLDETFRADRPFGTLGRLFWPERGAVALALVSYVFKASPVWILPVVTANIIDILAHRRDDGLRALWVNVIVGAVSIAQNIPTAAVYVHFLSRAVRNVEVRLRSALVRRLQMLSINYHSRVQSGALQTKVTRDVESVEMLSRQLVDVGFFAIMTVLVTLVVVAWRMPSFLPVFLIFVPLVWLVRWLVLGPLRARNETLRKEIEGMNSQLVGMINMIPITRAHAVEETEVARLEDRFSHVRRAARSFDFVAGTLGATTWVILMLFNLAGLAAAAWLSYQGRLPLTPGDVVLLAGYFNTIMAAVLQLNAMLPLMTRGLDGLRSIGEVLECPDVEENRGKQPVTQVRGEFVFENVSFAYANLPALVAQTGKSAVSQGSKAAGATNLRRAADLEIDATAGLETCATEGTSAPPPALRGLSFTVAAGETIGIVGPSGSGKSTLASLITGFHRPTGGRILLDGADMNTIDLRAYRRHLAVVSQQTILFSGTLRENIIYGARCVTEAELQRAVADANALEFIRELPRGLDTELGASGVQLSGGQRQRIAVARALLRNPRVLILDEATSALDACSEAVVQDALERLAKGRTTFIITHRPAVLRHASQILTLDKGAMVEAAVAAGVGSRAVIATDLQPLTSHSVCDLQ
jgi:ATP-binding cassette subfamily B protein